MKTRFPRHISTAVVLLLFTAPVFVDIGVRAGSAFSWTSQNGPIREFASSLWALQGGVSFRFPVGGGLSLRPELGLAMKGAGYYSVDHRADQTVHFDYLEFPVLLSFRKGPVDVFGGPFVAYMIHSTPLGPGNDWTWFQVKIRKFDAGLMVGARFFVLGPWFVEARLGLGLIPAVRVLDDPSVPAYRNQTLYLSTGAEFGR